MSRTNEEGLGGSSRVVFTTGSLLCAAVQCLIAISILIAPASATTSCLNESGKPVDWWIIMKYPYLTKSSDPSAQSGFGYSYADVNSQTLTYTGLRLDQNVKGALGSTITQIYKAKARAKTSKGSSSLGWLFYNDEAPDNEESFGHTKGVVAFDKTSGFWLVHSVPRFPLKAPYNFPDNEKIYGQSFICITYSADTFDTIGAQLQLNDPYVFDSNLPSALAKIAPHIQYVIDKNFTKGVSAKSVVQLQSKGGDSFLSFAKNSASKLDLYEDFVEPTLQTGLLVETWMNGPNSDKMPTMCPPKTPFKSINVREVSVSGDITWPETKDHSKWAVSIDTAGAYCIGDINRQYSQSTRGGGTICANNTQIWKSLSDMISGSDKC